MLFATNVNDNHEKIPATKGAHGICPFCKETLIPKCGSINIHHWAHNKHPNCDPWWESETEWHLQWKTYAPKEYTEVIITKNGVRHIADVYNSFSNQTYEFQASPISIEERKERESFYTNLSWIYNIPPHIQDNFMPRWIKDDIFSFRWRHPRKSLIVDLNPLCSYYIDRFPAFYSIFKITNVSIKSGEPKRYHVSGRVFERVRFVELMSRHG